MLQKVTQRGATTLGGGLVTFPNYFLLQPDQSPNVIDVKFSIGGIMEKRLGSTTLNTTILVSSAATGFSPDSSGTLSQSLQGYYKLDEQSGTRFDAFGSNSLTDLNSTGFNTGVRGNAAEFVRASSQSLVSADTSAFTFNGSQSFTVAGWVRLNSNPSQDQAIIDSIVDATSFHYRLYHQQNINRLVLDINSAEVIIATVSSNTFGAIPTSQFMNFVIGYNSANTRLELQVNTGAIDTSAAIVLVGTMHGLRVAAMNLAVTNHLDGRVDELGVWSKSLSTQERRDIFNAGAGNTFSAGASASGFGSFDFGSGFSGGQPLRWLIVAAGTGIFASSNRGVSFVVIATDRLADFQEFERSKSFLVAVSNTGNKVLFWPGSVGTFMTALAPNSAPPVKHALDFNGFLFLMNHSGGSRTVTYADNNIINTSPWNTTFQLESSQDDEITGGVTFSRNAYLFTKSTVSRVSPVGGNPDFSVLKVKDWGAVPRTIEKVTFKEFGEVMICLGYDKHVRIYDGADDQIISTPIEQDNSMSEVFLENINTPFIEKCHAQVDENEQVYRLWLVMTPSTETTHCVCLNLRTGAWYPYSNQSFNSAVMAESGNSRLLIGVRRDGFVHSMNSGNLDGTTPIDEFYESPYFFKTPRTVTKSEKISLYFSATSSGTVHFQDRLDYSNTFGPSRAQIMLADTVSTTIVNKVIDIPFTQNVYQYRITSSASTANPWKMSRTDIEGMDLGLGVG